MKEIISAGLILFHRENDTIEYLLLHYPGGHWDFTKGKVEPGENKKDAALRELQEETGLSAYIYDDFNESLDYFFIEQGSRIHKTVYYLIAETTEKRVVLSHEHIGFIWLPYEQALEILTYDNAKHILRKAHDVIQSIKKQ